MDAQPGSGHAEWGGSSGAGVCPHPGWVWGQAPCPGSCSAWSDWSALSQLCWQDPSCVSFPEEPSSELCQGHALLNFVSKHSQRQYSQFQDRQQMLGPDRQQTVITISSLSLMAPVRAKAEGKGEKKTPKLSSPKSVTLRFSMPEQNKQQCSKRKRKP